MNTIVPGIMRGVDGYAVLRDPASGILRRIKEDSVALVIAEGPRIYLPVAEVEEASALCLVHARSGDAPDLGWIVHSDLVALGET